MSVRYLSIDAEEVSAEWHTFLTAARADGVRFVLNEGHRTLARQTYFYNCMLTKRCNNGNLAAFPSPTAPHIRTGRIDHALDSDEMGALIAYGRKVGVAISLTVVGEPWHGEAPADQLRQFAARRKPDNSALKHLGKRRRKAATALLYHRRKRLKEAATGKGKLYRLHDRYAKRWHRVVSAMHKRAKPGVQKRILAKVLADRDGDLG